MRLNTIPIMWLLLREINSVAGILYLTPEEIIIQERQGRREELLNGISLGLELKFGTEGLALLPEIAQIQEIETLVNLREALRKVKSTDELRSSYLK